jgi:hypothetical protein
MVQSKMMAPALSCLLLGNLHMQESTIEDHKAPDLQATQPVATESANIGAFKMQHSKAFRGATACNFTV